MTDKNAVLIDILKVTDEIKQIKQTLKCLYSNDIQEIEFVTNGPYSSTYVISDKTVANKIIDIIANYSQELNKKLGDLCAMYIS